MELFDFFSRSNADYIDQLYQNYQKDPSSIDERWAVFFAGFEAGGAPRESSILKTLLSSASGSPAEGINHLVHAYRQYGHLIAQLNPLGNNLSHHPLLELSEFGFKDTSEEMNRNVGNGGFLGQTDSTLGGLVEALRATYCGTLGVEYLEIGQKDRQEWLKNKMESTLNRPKFSSEVKKNILRELMSAEGFEQYLHTKYVGQKRFSVQGSESVICMLSQILLTSSDLGASEAVLGMAHRGRLNVLAHILNKPYELIFREFEGTAELPDEEGDGDVKYHMGYSNTRELSNGKQVACNLSYNPSHLELVNPVVEGIVKSRQVSLQDDEGKQVLPILIHGEAAFTGQGVVPETLTLSQLKEYHTGGTVHVIINNQVGFTADTDETRCTPYPTEFAKTIEAPIFHVNAEDPEAVVWAGMLAAEYRQTFGSDVFIDLWCYRLYGHNETDDPTFTQPLMYQIIEKKKSIAELYALQLITQGELEESDVEAMKEQIKASFDEGWNAAKEPKPRVHIASGLSGHWTGIERAKGSWDADTKITSQKIQEIGTRITEFPSDFTPHPKLKKLLQAREEMARGEKRVDWGCGELWALGSLLQQGFSVRMAGQDCERGTFSHRHAVLHDYENGKKWNCLESFTETAKFTIRNSMLSELAVVGFEYGYSICHPKNLVIWEAQFGDFVNGAQPILDQFLSSGESKWDRMTGLVLLLPHGYEGQGPEHSSARLERFLQLCAENNMQVGYPSTPAQYFHLLRRQMLRPFRKPLVLMMPKSLLRDERASSAMEEFTNKNFEKIIEDTVEQPAKIQKVLFCSGKVFYTLKAAVADKPIAIHRVEQLYPFAEKEFKDVIAKYSKVSNWGWVQEEPKNMGAWSFIEPRLRELMPTPIQYFGRAAAASPAHGFYKVHHAEEAKFVDEALSLGSSQSISSPSKPKKSTAK